ncbi:hypothetical protein AAC387_Pa10g0851 [Persea americana]
MEWNRFEWKEQRNEFSASERSNVPLNVRALGPADEWLGMDVRTILNVRTLELSGDWRGGVKRSNVHSERSNVEPFGQWEQDVEQSNASPGHSNVRCHCMPSIVFLYSYDLVFVSTLTLDACYVLLYFVYLLLNMSLTMFLGVQTHQVSTTMRSSQARRSQRISNQQRRRERGVSMT